MHLSWLTSGRNANWSEQYLSYFFDYLMRQITQRRRSPCHSMWMKRNEEWISCSYLMMIPSTPRQSDRFLCHSFWPGPSPTVHWISDPQLQSHCLNWTRVPSSRKRLLNSTFVSPGCEYIIHLTCFFCCCCGNSSWLLWREHLNAEMPYDLTAAYII